MKKHYVVNPVNCIVSAVFSATMFAAFAVMLEVGRMLSAVVFLAVSLLFAGVAVYNGAVITLSEEGVTKTVLGLKLAGRKWSQLKEIGVCGLKVLKPKGSKKGGTMYIYFAEKELSEQERFEMTLQWPPKNGLCLLYNPKRLVSVLLHWPHDIVKFNTGNADLIETKGTK